MSKNQKIQIDVALAKNLIASQFPQWQAFPIKPVELSGWDNRTFHLGDEMVIRLPSDQEYAPQILKEFHWLPKIAQGITLQITKPLALGRPSAEYPWHWSINQWIDGQSVSKERIPDMMQFAQDLGNFLNELHKIDSTGGPAAGPDNFYRGGSLSAYDAEMRQGISLIQNDHDKVVAERLWNEALSSFWQSSPVWVHGDIAVGNLLVKQGKLCGIIDFGQLAIGDPACDLAIAWNFFAGQSREAFRKVISLDRDTWVRALGWTLWKTVCWPVKGTHVKQIIRDVLDDYQSEI